MTKLSDTQLMILSAATQRADRNVLPLPASLRGGAAQKVIGSLIAKGLVNEIPAAPGARIWCEADGKRLGVIATDTAFQALGIKRETGEVGQGGNRAKRSRAKLACNARKPPQGRTGGRKPKDRARNPAQAEVAPAGSARKARLHSKQAQLVTMLRRPDGASLDEIIAATGWQAHTVRGATAGALKKKLGLTIASGKVEGRGRVYRVTD